MKLFKHVDCISKTCKMLVGIHYCIIKLYYTIVYNYLVHICQLFNTDTLFQIVFEALKGNGYQGDIALDDITITNGACPPPGKYLCIQYMYMS